VDKVARRGYKSIEQIALQLATYFEAYYYYYLLLEVEKPYCSFIHSFPNRTFTSLQLIISIF
jgi:hypothetical protein